MSIKFKNTMSNPLHKKAVAALFFCFFSLYGSAQSGHEITINLKNCKDTLAYLTFYQFDKSYIKDTCTNIKNGKIIFKGKNKLDKGIYTLVSQQKSIYFDFFIDDETQHLKLTSDRSHLPLEIVAENSTRENDFFKYIRFLGEQNKEFMATKQKLVGLSKADSLSKITSSQKAFEKTIRDYETDFLEKNKGSYLGDVLNLKMDKVLKDVPKASNGRPDSLKVYHYYKTHYWDGVDFKDDVIMRNPFFANKIKNYFELAVVKHPDSVSVEIDRLMQKTTPGSLLNKMMLAHFTSTYEVSKIMGMEKVFVHMADAYLKTGKAVGTYEDETIAKIIKRADLLRPLLIGAPAPELMMIKASDRDKIVKMGFENVKSSDEVTNLFYGNKPELDKLFYNLYSVNADYLVLVFWDVDCGHCQIEIPKLLEEYHTLQKQYKGLKVYSVYTQQESEKYLKYIDEKKLDWINVYDGAHYNNITEKYDIYSTPVIYVLDRNKIIKAKRIGAEQVKAILKDIAQEYKAAK